MGKLYLIEDFLHRVKDSVKIEADKDYKLVTVKMHHKGVTLREIKKGAELGSNMFRIKPGQFILSGIDARNGAFGVVPEELDGAIITNDFWCYDIDEKIVKRDFFYWLTNTPLFLDACIKSSEGTTQRIRLQNEKFKKFELRLPPLTEQDKFLKRISKIESETSALKGEFKNQEVYLKQLRQSILQEAIEGKLTADWRKTHPVVKGNPDFDAEALLYKIKAEKSKLIAEGKQKKEKPLPEIADSEKPFELPVGWVWCRLGECIINLARGVSPIYADESNKFIINQKCIRWFDIDKTWIKPVSEVLYSDNNTDKLTEFGDLLVNSTGEGTIGRCAIVNNYSKGYLFDTHILRIKNHVKINSYYMMLFINSVFGQNQVKDLKGAKTTKQTELGVNNLNSFVFPLPPPIEQKAIVDRVNGFLEMVDLLENQVNERKTMADELMQSVLREAFG